MANDAFIKQGELRMRLFMLEQQFQPELERAERFEKNKEKFGDKGLPVPPRLARRLARYEKQRADLISEIERFNANLPVGQKLKRRIKAEEFNKHKEGKR